MTIRRRNCASRRSTGDYKELGRTDGFNVRIDYRWTSGNAALTRAQAAELVSLKPDVILGASTPVAAASMHCGFEPRDKRGFADVVGVAADGSAFQASRNDNPVHTRNAGALRYVHDGSALRERQTSSCTLRHESRQGSVTLTFAIASMVFATG